MLKSITKVFSIVICIIVIGLFMISLFHGGGIFSDYSGWERTYWAITEPSPPLVVLDSIEQQILKNSGCSSLVKVKDIGYSRTFVGCSKISPLEPGAQTPVCIREVKYFIEDTFTDRAVWKKILYPRVGVLEYSPADPSACTVR